MQENGSLLFNSVEKQDEAEYRCKVQRIILTMMMTMMMKKPSLDARCKRIDADKDDDKIKFENPGEKHVRSRSVSGSPS